MESIVLIGFGGHAKSVADCIEKRGLYSIAGYTDEKICVACKYPYLGTDDELEAIFDRGVRNAAVCVGYLGKGEVRKKIYCRLKEIGYKLPVIADESAVVSESAVIGEGTFIGKDAVINADAKIGKMAIINTKALVEHECVVGDFAHVAVAAVLCGQAKVGTAAFVGANATLLQCMSVGDGAVVPAGMTVRRGKRMKRVCIIAEAGVNHNGDFGLAKKMVDAAHEAGADYIKFQTFVPEKLVSKYAGKAEYQKETTGADESQLQMLKKLALSDDEYAGLNEYCRKVGIGFISTPFDDDSIDLLSGFDMDFWKIPSGEVTNLPYLEKIAATHKPIVLSTGMCSLDEVRAAVEALSRNGAGKITLLHCTTQYPAPYEDVNLNVMETLRMEFGVEVGYSDHTKGICVPVAAAAMGACVIEKHFTLDKKLEGPDHKASLEPDELKEMVEAIRCVEKAMGTGEKKVTASEAGNRAVARKSITAAVDIKKGEILTEENITTKRPGTGISPMKWHEVLGTRAVRDFEADEMIEVE
jgi:N,N'-diacetyllegionaminate synthase